MHNLLKQNNQRHGETTLKKKAVKVQNNNEITKESGEEEEGPIAHWII